VTEPGGEPAPLPRRPPRPLIVHFWADTVIAFLLTALLFYIVGIPLWFTLVFSLGAGLGAAPYTRRAEIAALAKRPEATDEDH
jgi:hypothetical protein